MASSSSSSSSMGPPPSRKRVRISLGDIRKPDWYTQYPLFEAVVDKLEDANFESYKPSDYGHWMRELYRALVCAYACGTPTEVRLPPLLDYLWRLALLCTVEYRSFCFQQFGKFIDYAFTQKLTTEERLLRIQSVQHIYQVIFHEDPSALTFWSVSPPPSSRCRPSRST